MAEGFRTPEDGHPHQFNVKFKPSDREEYTINCNQPRTVLDAIKSHEEYQNANKCADENIIIQLGKTDKEIAVPTHFPCSCIKDGELLIISCESEKVEEAQNKPETVHPQDKYCVFYIDTVGGKDTKTKQFFRSKAIKQFKHVCVYGEKGMTVEESLKRDGRFIDDLGDFKLSDNESPEKLTGCKQLVDSLDGKQFKLCLPRKNNKVAQQRGTSVKTLVDKNVNPDEIYKILGQQFPDLKQWIEDHFPSDSYQEAVSLRKEDFGKIQKSFSEVHRVRKLLKLSESVCKVVVEDVCVGTGFILFDNFILTNAHLFKEVARLRGDNWKEYVKVTAVFNYENPDLESNSQSFNVKEVFVDLGDTKLDYAVLELDLEDQTADQTTETVQLPAGLLKEFGPLPESGEACVIGHPGGDVKKMDPTCIIEKENREQAVNKHLEQYKNSLFTVHTICEELKNQGIENILKGGSQADEIITYSTFMYHGASGSPVFDADCKLFGLHTAGYNYQRDNPQNSVIQFAQPLLTIFEKLFTKLKEHGNKQLLKRVEEEAKGNSDLERVIESLKLNKSSRAEEKEKGNQSLEKSFKTLKLNQSSRVEEEKKNQDPQKEVKVEPENPDESSG